jgi:hypothetical protein
MLTVMWARCPREAHGTRGTEPQYVVVGFLHPYHILSLTRLASCYEFHLYYDI